VARKAGNGAEKGAKPGRKPQDLSPHQEIVIAMALAGVSHKLIAKAIGTSMNGDQLRAQYATELEEAKSLCDADAVKGLMANVRAGKEASIFFYLKTRCGWREVQRIEHSGPDGVPLVDAPPQETYEQWTARKHREEAKRLESAAGAPK
jgi:hypothetical protein